MLVKTLTLFFLFVSLLLSTAVFAQDTVSASYFKKDNSHTKNRDSAYYLLVIKRPDTGSVFYNVSEYYINGRPKLLGKSSQKEYISLQGKCTKFYASGKTQEVATFKNGTPIGDMTNYYPNGNIYAIKTYPNTIENRGSESDFSKDYLITACNDSTGKVLVADGNGYYIGYSSSFTDIEEEGNVKNGLATGAWKGSDNAKKNRITFEEKYENGKLISGTSKGESGSTIIYTKRAISPAYPGGINAFYSFLGNHIQYPSASKKLEIQGKVVVSFVVERDGKLTDIKVTRSVSQDIDAEAIRVISSSPKWTPGEMYGRNVRVQYSIPINFALR